MTHFRCAVFSYDPNGFDALLAPYSETDEEYFEFTPLSNENILWLRERYNKDIEDKKLLKDVSFPEWAKARGYTYQNGSIGIMENANAKWDYYTLDGGDWEFEFKDGETYDDRGHARKNQFTYRETEYSENECRKHYANMQKLADNRDGDNYEYINSFLTEYPTVESYLEYSQWAVPYAYITPDGEWHAPGNVGWFAASDDTPETRNAYFEEWKAWVNSPDNPYVNFVDCHI